MAEPAVLVDGGGIEVGERTVGTDAGPVVADLLEGEGAPVGILERGGGLAREGSVALGQPMHPGDAGDHAHGPVAAGELSGGSAAFGEVERAEGGVARAR